MLGISRYIYDGDKHQEIYTETFAMQRFGALWIDYLYHASVDDDSKGKYKECGNDTFKC